MSVAFTREESAETAAEVELPDRPISPHPNWVTARGLGMLTAALRDARTAYENAQRLDDANERRRAAAPALRDIRYFSARVSSAQLQPAPTDRNVVTFGSQVSFARDDGRTQSFRIVGEDEAEPKNGTISYVSPVARALLGKSVGDVATVGEHELAITAIS